MMSNHISEGEEEDHVCQITHQEDRPNSSERLEPPALILRNLMEKDPVLNQAD